MSKRENEYQAALIKKLEEQYPNAIITKLDPNYIQGIPDILVLENDRWGALEAKRSAGASHRPNQDYYVELMDRMSFASFICPENEKEVLHELEQALHKE